ncbi:hypothetical protein SIID45300_00069 [Candidatus Magnetaquicoccaceae bacterium FCR-1]|uniref:DUF1640 domain-containing protein n=1 Tax=Candidatus Magnetaquiglobus chichijimensis TaxID=3141448 RepID=A0ABQ0C4G3_9PROT
MSGLVATFDTHKFVKQMVATGFTEEQAETQVALLTDILSYQLSTKADIFQMDTHVLELQRDIKSLDAGIETVQADLKRDIKELDARIETVQADLKRDIKELDARIETVQADLKRDIKELDARIETTRADLQRDIEATRVGLQRDIEVAKSETIRWTAGMFAAQTALIIGAMFAVMKFSQPALAPVSPSLPLSAPLTQTPPPGLGR